MIKPEDIRFDLAVTSKESASWGYKTVGEPEKHFVKVSVDPDGTVRAWDGDMYTLHHTLTAEQIAEGQRIAAEKRAERRGGFSR